MGKATKAIKEHQGRVEELEEELDAETSFDKVVGLLSPSTGWCVQFEWPQEISGIFEVWSNCHYFVHQVFNANNSKLAQSSFDYIIACNWGAFAIDLNESTLVNQVSNTH